MLWPVWYAHPADNVLAIFGEQIVERFDRARIFHDYGDDRYSRFHKKATSIKKDRMEDAVNSGPAFTEPSREPLREPIRKPMREPLPSLCVSLCTSNFGDYIFHLKLSFDVRNTSIIRHFSYLASVLGVSIAYRR